jgi:hypothetical protein
LSDRTNQHKGRVWGRSEAIPGVQENLGALLLTETTDIEDDTTLEGELLANRFTRFWHRAKLLYIHPVRYHEPRSGELPEPLKLFGACMGDRGNGAKALKRATAASPPNGGTAQAKSKVIDAEECRGPKSP